MNAEDHSQLFERLAHCYPNPKCELLYHNPFEILVAVMLSAHTTDKQVNRVTPKLFACAPTPEAMAQLAPSAIERLISSVGLSPLILAASGILHEA